MISLASRMRDDWLRGEPVVRLSADEIAGIIRAAFPGARVASAELVVGGLSNSNYRLTLDGRASPLRLRIFHHGAEPAERECAILAQLPPDVPATRVHHFEREGVHGRPHAVLEWVEGERLEVVLPSMSPKDVAHVGHDVGRVLAAIHRRTFAVTGFLSPGLEVVAPFAADARGLTEFARATLLDGRRGRRLGEAFVLRFLSWLGQAAALLDTYDGPPCLTHGDFGGSNILVTRSEGQPYVSAVLDWEYACSGTLFLDLGNLLRPPLGDIAAFEAAVVNGYRSGGRRLPENWRRVALLTDLFAWLEFLQREVLGEGVVASARARLEYTMTHLG